MKANKETLEEDSKADRTTQCKLKGEVAMEVATGETGAVVRMVMVTQTEVTVTPRLVRFSSME